MKLIIKNFAKIKSEELKFDGITVIAGNNNTGKSTIGKVLFAIFDSLHNIDETVRKQKISAYRNAAFQSFREINFDDPQKENLFYSAFRRTWIHNKKPFEDTTDIKEFLDRVREFADSCGLDAALQESVVDSCLNKLKRYSEISDEHIRLTHVNNEFKNIFNNQLSNCADTTIPSIIQLNLRRKKIVIHIEDNNCIEMDFRINIINNAFYIDNPFIIDSVGSLEDFQYRYNTDKMDSKLLASLSPKKQEPNYLEDILNQEKLQSVLAQVKEIIPGSIYSAQNDSIFLHDDRLKEDLNIRNLSTGLKSFAIIKLLIENNALHEKDILILDEPEIHLHPKWQLIYAKLLVKLQKAFDLTLLLTTHSPFFLDAIELFSKKYKRGEYVNYYLSYIDENTNQAEIEDVTDHLDKIYGQMADPVQELEDLRSKLQEELGGE